MGNSMRLGGGGRFKKLVGNLMSGDKGLSRKDAEATAAMIGRRKYGKKHFQKLAAKGR